jgi:GTP cyclohydrolase FolE2
VKIFSINFLVFYQTFFQYRQIEAERLNFIEVKYKAQRKYNKLFKILEKEKFDLQFQLDSEQKGIHARRDSEVCTKQRQKSFQFF